MACDALRANSDHERGLEGHFLNQAEMDSRTSRISFTEAILAAMKLSMNESGWQRREECAETGLRCVQMERKWMR